MKTITLHNFNKLSYGLALLVFSILGFTSITNAQVIRPYGLVYSNNLRGGHTMFGNTVMAIKDDQGNVLTSQMNDFGSYSNGTTSGYGNDNSNMQYIDVDGAGTTSVLVASGETWNVSNTTSAPSGWPSVTTLPAGPSATPMGFGPTGTVATSLANDKRTYYFVKAVTLNPATYATFDFNLTIDDGAVVYVNGTEVGRYNMPSGTPSYTTNASSNVDPEQGYSFSIASSGSAFVNGTNYIQVEVHKSASNESGTDDLFFDFSLSGTTANETFNSSSADLVLPATGVNTIKFARLYWGGRVRTGGGGDDNINLRTIKIRKGTSGAYTVGIAPTGQVDKSRASSSQSDSVYQSYIDITNFVKTNGAGTYTVADVACATGARSSGGFYGGWSIVVVYENPSVSYSSVRVYDGYLQVYSGGNVYNQSITLTGFNAPSTPLAASDAWMSTMSWEGDANLAASSQNPAGDFVKINGYTVSNAVNPSTNFWNGTISKNGAHITTKNPDFKNQMGIDIDEEEVGVGYGIVANATDVSVEFGTEADQYFPSVFAFTMKTKDPSITLDKTVSDQFAPFKFLQINEELTYTLSGGNVGVGNAYNCVVVDTVPSNVTYVPGSLQVVSSPGITVGAKTDASGDDEAFVGTNGSKTYVKFFIGTGATATSGGVLQPGQTYSLKFKVKTPSNGNLLSVVVNTARITGESLSGDPYVDDGTAIIGAEGGPLPVRLISFTAKKEATSLVVLKWTTGSETSTDRYEVEQSTDGVTFSKAGVVKANGTTSQTSLYQFNGNLPASAYGVLYFRLKVVDENGKVSYTKIVAVNLSSSYIRTASVYPNPFVNNIKVQMQSEKEENAMVRLINQAGQLVYKKMVNLQSGDNVIVLSEIEPLAKGMYKLELISESGNVVQQKVMKQ